VVLGVVCSVIFPLSTFWFEKDKAIIGLIVFCVFLLGLLFIIVYVLLKLIDKSNAKGYSKKSTNFRYETADGVNLTYSTHRVIQCRTLFLDQIDYEFKWKGNLRPLAITSSLHKVGPALYHTDDNKFDTVPLIFKQGISYKELALIHVVFQLSDPEKTAPPHIGVAIDEPIEYINFRIVLKQKSSRYNKAAKLVSKKIGTPSADLKPITTIPFDSVTKTYEYDLIEPKVGHYYRIVWEH
jgi:hypothetical protein